MTKKKVDYSTAGLSILGVKTDSEPDEGSLAIIPVPIIEKVSEPIVTEGKTENVEPPKKQPAKFISRTYYITLEQYKALKLRAALSDDPEEKDISAIVRAALNKYLAGK